MKDLVQGATEDVKGIADAATHIREIAEVAEQMEADSILLLDDARSSVELSLATVEVTGQDVVTGGVQEWEFLSLKTEDRFNTMVDGKLNAIDGGAEYRRAFRELFVIGRSMSQARLALAKANTDLAAMILRRRSAERGLDLLERRLEEVGNELMDDQAVQNMFFERATEAKRGVYLAIEAYQRALSYFALVHPSRLPALPSITDGVDEFSVAVKAIAGKKLELEALAGLATRPSTMSGLEIVLNDKATLSTLRKGKGGVSVTVDGSEPAFKRLRRVRLSRIRAYLDGLPAALDIACDIRCDGVYRDRLGDPDGKDDTLWCAFVSQPSQQFFSYSTDRPDRPTVEAEVAERYRDDFFRPTPFALWDLDFSRQDGKDLDLTTVTAIRLQFFGECSTLRQ